MPYLLMAKTYDYDDQFYYEQDGGYPELVFEDDQYLEALAMLDTYQQDEWLSCTPLVIFYQDATLEELSSSNLDEHTLARAISDIVGQTMSAKELLEKDFKLFNLTSEQARLIALLLDRVGSSYLTFVKTYREA